MTLAPMLAAAMDEGLSVIKATLESPTPRPDRPEDQLCGGRLSDDEIAQEGLVAGSGEQCAVA